jgi:sporulation protein YlmC with PRC-barrel domain
MEYDMQQPPDQPYSMEPGQGSPPPGVSPQVNQPQEGVPRDAAAPATAIEWRHAHTETEMARGAQLEPGVRMYITLPDMVGRAIVDLDTGSNLGTVADLVLSRDHRTVEAFATHSQSLLGSDAFPARDSNVGGNAITLPRGAMRGFDGGRLTGLPFATELVDKRLMTDTGETVGTVKDIRFDPHEDRVLGYEVESAGGGVLKRLTRRRIFVPEDAIQNYGVDVLLISEAKAQQYSGE